jgi:hypothetical protein
MQGTVVSSNSRQVAACVLQHELTTTVPMMGWPTDLGG